MPKKGEKLSAAHLAKMLAGRKAKKGGPQATAPKLATPGTNSGKGTKNVSSAGEATKPLISQGQIPNLTNKKLNNVVEDSAKVKVAPRKRGVKAAGVPTSIQAQQVTVNSNTGPSALISNELPGQMEVIKKVLKRDIPNIVGNTVDASPPQKTVDNIPSVDAKSLEGNKVPFSFNALRQKLMC
jgi:hypothetical protein